MRRIVIIHAPLFALAVLAAGTAWAQSSCPVAPDGIVTRQELQTGGKAGNAARLLRFAQISDAHILDDDGQILNGLSPLDPVDPILASAQRFQDEYTDEVLNAMIGSINACHEPENNPIEFMISTGDNVDLGTVNEVRRFIDNIDGKFEQPSAFETRCLNSLPPETRAVAGESLCARFTGRGRPDTQTEDPDPSNPAYQVIYTRMPLQLLQTETAVLTGRDESGTPHPNLETATHAPGFPGSLRCSKTPSDQTACENEALNANIPWYVVFGNHDGTARGTVTYEPGFQEISLVTGRHYMQEQHEFIDEFFEPFTSSEPSGHGFKESSKRDDPDLRNDGYYALDWPQAPELPKFRLIVLNTLVDGVDGELLSIDAGAVGPARPTRPFATDEGGINEEQFDWLHKELENAQLKNLMVLVFSHHPDVSFFDVASLGFVLPGYKSVQDLDAELAAHPNVVAWIAGHTHLNRIRAFKVTDGMGSNGEIKDVTVNCPAGMTCPGFWQIETASLIDTPQEARIIEVFDNVGSNPHTGVLRATLIEHDLDNPKRLARADDRCQFYLTTHLINVASGLPDSTEAGLPTICAPESEPSSRDGKSEDRNVDLVFKMP